MRVNSLTGGCAVEIRWCLAQIFAGDKPITHVTWTNPLPAMLSPHCRNNYFAKAPIAQDFLVASVDLSSIKAYMISCMLYNVLAFTVELPPP